MNVRVTKTHTLHDKKIQVIKDGAFIPVYILMSHEGLQQEVNNFHPLKRDQEGP